MNKLSPEQQELMSYITDIADITPEIVQQGANGASGVGNTLAVLTSEENTTKIALLKSLGISSNDIAERFGVPIQNINAIFNTEEYRLAVQNLSAGILLQAKAVLSTKTFKAINVLDGCLESSDARVRMQTAFGILDRLGMGKNIEVNLKTKSVKSEVDITDVGALDEFIVTQVSAMQEIKEMESAFEDVPAADHVEKPIGDTDE